ncbi:PHP domain protein, partial [mine drainage metagenome]
MTTAETMTQWPYAGSRWWKFDFHTHTRASRDTPWHQQSLELSPQAWLLRYMAAGLDCVAVTDHNSGAWIDVLKSTYAEMRQEADAGSPPSGFRELTIFPGVEVSAHGGVHVLALFDPGKSMSDIDTLLGQVDYRGTKG